MVTRADIQAEAEFIQRLFIDQARQEDAIMELAGAKPELGTPSLSENKQEKPDPLMQFFNFAHLQEPLQDVSKQFAGLATWIDTHLPRNPERTVALRKLLEAKDCAVRARLFKP